MSRKLTSPSGIQVCERMTNWHCCSSTTCRRRSVVVSMSHIVHEDQLSLVVTGRPARSSKISRIRQRRVVDNAWGHSPQFPRWLSGKEQRGLAQLRRQRGNGAGQCLICSIEPKSDAIVTSIACGDLGAAYTRSLRHSAYLIAVLPNA